MEKLTIKNYFENVYGMTNRKVKLYLVKHCKDMNDVNDVFQETYMEFYKVLDSKGISYIQNPEALLLQITKTKIHRFYRLFQRFSNQISIDDEEQIEGDSLPFDEKDVDEQVIDRELMGDIQKKLKKKPGDIQKIFYLYYSMDYTLEEIGKMLKMNESTVKSKLYRTLKEFRNYYKEAEHERA